MNVLLFFIIVGLYIFFYVKKTHPHLINKKPYSLYLDDLRPLPVQYKADKTTNWVICRTSKDAINYVIFNGPPAFMSLDHDLGYGDDSMNFLKWLFNTYSTLLDRPLQPPPYIVHSENPVGRQNIISFMESWKKSMGV